MAGIDPGRLRTALGGLQPTCDYVTRLGPDEFSEHVLAVCTSGAFIGGKVGLNARMPAPFHGETIGRIEGSGGWNDRVAGSKTPHDRSDP